MTGRPPSVTYADAEPNGLAAMIGALIEQNLARDPARRRLLRPCVVARVATDADVGVTLRCSAAGVLVRNDADPRADLEVATDGHRLLALAATPLLLGLPDVRSPDGREAVGAIGRREVRIRGLARHPLALTRLTRLLSAG